MHILNLFLLNKQRNLFIFLTIGAVIFIYVLTLKLYLAIYSYIRYVKKYFLQKKKRNIINNKRNQMGLYFTFAILNQNAPYPSVLQ